MGVAETGSSMMAPGAILIADLGKNYLDTVELVLVNDANAQTSLPSG
jgi:hypothetical protein